MSLQWFILKQIKEGMWISLGVHLQPTENVSVVRIAQIVNSENDTTEVYVEELLESSTDSIANNSEIWSSKGKPSEEILATKNC